MGENEDIGDKGPVDGDESEENELDKEEDVEGSDKDSAEDEEDEASGTDGDDKTEPASHPRPALDSSAVAAKVAASQAQFARHTQKHHGQKSQATKTGRRHGGGKGKHNQRRAVADSLTF